MRVVFSPISHWSQHGPSGTVFTPNPTSILADSRRLSQHRSRGGGHVGEVTRLTSSQHASRGVTGVVCAVPGPMLPDKNNLTSFCPQKQHGQPQVVMGGGIPWAEFLFGSDTWN